MSFILSDYNNFKVIFYSSIQRLKDAALVKLFRERTLKKREDVEHRDWDNISLDEVIPNFSVFILGVLVSVIVLIFECFISTLVQRRNVFKRSSESAFEEKKTFRKNCVY
ncbi:hypothetical protein C0J52_17424 [Blattella germanica]|nr:hypothetical protein C0J52_17424 [Blattella germanica]